MSGNAALDLTAVVHARVSPKGVLDNLSQQEVDKLLDRGQGGLYPLFRRCALAVLNSGTLIDDARLIFDAYKDFELRIVREPWGIKLEMQHAPGSAFVDGEMIRGIKEQTAAAATDPAADAALRGQLSDFGTQLGAIEAQLYQVRNRSRQDPLNYPIRINNKIAALAGVAGSGPFRPTDQAIAVYNVVSAMLKAQTDRLDTVLRDDLAGFNREARAAGQQPIVPSTDLPTPSPAPVADDVLLGAEQPAA